MKVRVTFVVNVDDKFRRALRLSENRAGLASRNEVRWWYRLNGDSDELASELIDEHLEPVEFIQDNNWIHDGT